MEKKPDTSRRERRWFSFLAGFDKTTDPLLLIHPSLEPASQYERSGGYISAALICALTTIVARALRDLLDPANLILLYLIAVVGIAVKLGRKPAILASFLSVLAFDFFLVPPYHSFTVEDTQYLLTFAIMLVVSLLISTLTANLRYQVRVARYRERRTSALFDLSKDLSAALTNEQIVDIGKRHLGSMFQAEAAILLPDRHGRLKNVDNQKEDSDLLPLASMNKAQEMYDAKPSALPDLQSDSVHSHSALYLPLHAPMRNRGVLVIRPQDQRQFTIPEQQLLLLTCAAQIALALERVHYVEIAQEAEVAMKEEQLRNSLLSALSHDVRTPLTAIIGMSSMLSANPSVPEGLRQELADALQEEALRMNGLVTNLLDMARLHSGRVKLNLHWQMLEEVVGSGLSLMSRILAGRNIELSLSPDLPLLEFDAILIERVLCNLLANVAKYTPPGSPCSVEAERCDDMVRISVKDAGPGIPIGMEEAIFDKFSRGETESTRSGVGLGLSICRAIVEAHGGRIWAESRPEGGASLVFTLPVGSPPAGGEISVKPMGTDVDEAA